MSSVRVETHVYARRGGQELLLDIHRPDNVSGPLPVVLFIHGGGWFMGNRTTGPDFSRFFARDGFAMVSIEYRLSSTAIFPACLEDVQSAVRWVRENVGDRIGIWGCSAGGHLGALVALALPAGEICCVLDAYGPSRFDLMDQQAEQEQATLQAPIPEFSGPPAMGTHSAADSPESRLLGAPVPEVPELVRAASPLTCVRADAPPFLLMHGNADRSVPRGQSVILYEALAAAGNDVTLRLVDGLPHSFFNRSDIDDAGPFRMEVREYSEGGTEVRREERAGVFDVAREFLQRNLIRDV